MIRRKLAVYGFVLVVAMGLALPMMANSARAAIPCPAGKTTFSGTVTDQEGNGLGGVLVALATLPNLYPQYGGTTTSSATGSWSLTFSYQCPMSARFYWQSNGPLVKTVSSIPFSSNYALTIWRVPAVINLLYEFPNDPSVTVNYSLAASLTFSFDATISGGINVGFLSVDAAGHVGASVTMGGGNSASGYSPYVIIYPVGTWYKVQDVSGNYVVYVLPGVAQSLWTGPVTDYLTVNDGINRDNAASPPIIPYVQVARHTTVQLWRTFSTTITVDAQVGGSAFGVGLTTHVGVSGTVTLTWGISFTNSGTKTNCYVLYQLGPEMHAWLYSNNACP